MGQYTPGSNTLLLSRVTATDANGAGGQLVLQPGALNSGVLTLNLASEIAVLGRLRAWWSTKLWTPTPG